MGDSVVDLATECRRCLGDRDPCGWLVSGEAGRLRDFGVRSSVFSVAGGEVDWLRGLCCGVSFSPDAAATTAALTADAGSHEEAPYSSRSSAARISGRFLNKD